MLHWPVILAALLALSGCSTRPSLLQLEGQALGTTWSVQTQDSPPGITPEALRREIDSALAQVDEAMSTWRDDSSLVHFNNNTTTEWVDVPRSLALVVAEALRISELSGGAFDVTVNPLVELWGFGAADRRGTPPDAAAVAATLQKIGYRNIEVGFDPPQLRKTEAELSIDLSAIAKGYAVDQLAATLEHVGSNNYLVEIGGELVGRGLNADGVPWRIAVERPDAGARDVQQVIELRDRALATSGDYRNYFESDGQRFSHTIDPRSGAPVTHKLASVTVLAGTAMRADALATALLVLGPQAGMELADSNDIAAIFVTREADGFGVQNSAAMQCYLEAGGLQPAGRAVPGPAAM
ncbi:MAG: FAD:protein FMN transferase [Gammaproteobacteria bacterium]|nr:FAD:protein FMN transferase [Gammaproteobacteria bacterium]